MKYSQVALLLAAGISAMPTESKTGTSITQHLSNSLMKRQSPQDDELCHAYCSVMQPIDGMATFDEVEELATKLEQMAADGTPCLLQREPGSDSEAITTLATVGEGDDAKEVRIWFNNLDGMEPVYKATYDCTNIAEVVRSGLKGTCGDYSAQNGAPGLVYGAADISNCYHPEIETVDQQVITTEHPGAKVEVVFVGWPIHAG
ncbi:hypothetical protein EJ04DRAFT_581504 [Polyplosphaeria fusca]|uniref:Uncharacterized protein n=1 Tax=Polyplosphaeria fusca TaxID=682080 RepID=A0A9P4QKY2_9PLEO|nr:hypothetical protein EJ04DRAFT_581504 [Polyplosphaeria fusca]